MSSRILVNIIYSTYFSLNQTFLIFFYLKTFRLFSQLISQFFAIKQAINQISPVIYNLLTKSHVFYIAIYLKLYHSYIIVGIGKCLHKKRYMVKPPQNLSCSVAIQGSQLHVQCTYIFIVLFSLDSNFSCKTLDYSLGYLSSSYLNEKI